VKYYTNKARQAGMTLIELTVVLLVLVGLAGLLIPYVSGFVTKTHDSTGSSNIQALNNAVQRYAVEHYDNYPDKLDSLVETTSGTPYGKMMSTKFYKTLTLDADKASSLTKAGINTVMLMDATATNATFDNTNGTFDIADNAKVLEIDTTEITDLSAVMGKPLSTIRNHYVVFGLGDDSTIAGQTVSDVPVHFASNADMGADKRYNHFVLVFEVPKEGYCAIDGMFMAYSDDSTATGGTASSLSASGAEAAANAAAANVNLAACEAADTTYLGSDTGGVVGTGGTVSGDGNVANVTFAWNVPGAATAKFVGSAMSMMSDFEGLGGAMSRYYDNTASN